LVPSSHLLTLTFELVFLKSFQPLSLHSLRRVALGSGGFDGVVMQIFGEPTEIAVANERVTGQVPAHLRFMELDKCFFSTLFTWKSLKELSDWSLFY